MRSDGQDREVRAIIFNEIQVDIQGVFVQTIKSCHFYNVILLNCTLGSIGEAHDGVASGRPVVEGGQR